MYLYLSLAVSLSLLVLVLSLTTDNTTLAMRMLNALPLSGLLSLAGLSLGKSNADGDGCSKVERIAPNSIFYPGSSVFEEESQNFWSNTEILNPACVFRPLSADELGGGIQRLRGDNAHFAVRGGGHMGIPVLISF